MELPTPLNDPLENKDDSQQAEQPDPFLVQMNRGEYLRQLRLLALQDEIERLAESQAEHHRQAIKQCFEEKKCEDEPLRSEVQEVQLLQHGETMLNYSAYLSHQRYYDDLKHVDMNYINYGPFGKEGEELIIEQRKRLGKGGFCWDAAFMLGEHVISREKEWNTPSTNEERQVVLELGAGTGLCGLMVAKATDSRVLVTDLPELMGLIDDNIRRNFVSDNNGGGTAESRVLRWGIQEDYGDAPFDVIIGADIVASLYDPIALARTLHALSGPDTKIYISSKSRLDRPHEEFDGEMNRLFERVERVVPESRLRNPNVFVMVFAGKRDV